MNSIRSYPFVAVSSIALVVLLVIQVNWILETAKVKEQLFTEKANMVLTRTSEAFSAYKKTHGASSVKNERHQIDSLLSHYMQFYNFHIDYSFEMISCAFPNTNGTVSITALTPTQPACYQKSLEDAANTNGMELKLVFPEKEQFIMEEMGILFIASVILIIVVLVMFWRTILSLMKEKQLSEHTRDFLNNMTHEFKTPLTNIALAGKMIIKDPVIKQEDKIKHYSGIILEENEKLRLQVEQVLSMTALERGEIPLQKTELDVHQLIHDAVKCIRIQIEHRQGNLKLKLDAEQCIIMGDRTHLTNALCNLIDNAIKYSNGKPELSIQTSNSGENLVIAISDKGIGIDPKYREKVFDKYFRVPTGDVHDVKGFGLGLAYVKKIVELHQGKLELESEKGEGLPAGQAGTTFTITLTYV
jgi:two-component system phosphate regulon sensor histidine kinase PhoR